MHATMPQYLCVSSHLICTQSREVVGTLILYLTDTD